MASYIEGALIKDEKVIYTGHVSLWSLAPWIILGFLLLPFVGIGLIFWLVAFIRYKTTELENKKGARVTLNFFKRGQGRIKCCKPINTGFTAVRTCRSPIGAICRAVVRKG